ncbi:MAG: flagellar export protein FliJ [Sedimentisphaerales bacterium]|nr:flagellar export protein FliJ [Sedimentisphaerales bacterium]MBN2843040.1 flagellar export protein FliJ [Sedimentisphaerales bacterium]
MKKFEFRLETVLRMKRQIEDEKKRVVGELMAQINKQQQEALEINQTIIQQGNVLKAKFQKGEVDTAWIAYYQSFVTDMRREIARKIASVTEIQKKLTLARQELANAAKETKTLEKLKERQLKEYTHHIESVEKKELDEIGTQMFMRNNLELRNR